MRRALCGGRCRLRLRYVQQIDDDVLASRSNRPLKSMPKSTEYAPVLRGGGSQPDVLGGNVGRAIWRGTSRAVRMVLIVAMQSLTNESSVESNREPVRSVGCGSGASLRAGIEADALEFVEAVRYAP